MNYFGIMEKNQNRNSRDFFSILEFPTVSNEDPGGIIHIDNQPFGLKALCIIPSSQERKLILRIF